MVRSQLHKRINETVGKYGNMGKRERVYLVNMIMSLVDLYTTKFFLSVNEGLLRHEVRKTRVIDEKEEPKVHQNF